MRDASDVDIRDAECWCCCMSSSSLLLSPTHCLQDGCRVSKNEVRGRGRTGCKSTIAGAGLLFVQLVRLPPRGDLLPGRCFPFCPSPHGLNHSCSGREAHSVCQVTRRVWEGRKVSLLRSGRGKVLVLWGGDASPDPRFPRHNLHGFSRPPLFRDRDSTGVPLHGSALVFPARRTGTGLLWMVREKRCWKWS